MKIAVVIPALDEADDVEEAIESVSKAQSKSSSESEDSRRLAASPAMACGGGAASVDGAGTGGAAAIVSGADIDTEINTDIDVEIIVVDGGSSDDTRARAQALGARVVSSPRGRARQLQAGLKAFEEGSRGSTGACEVLLFLHADTRLPRGWGVAVRESLQDPGVVGGAFRLRFDDRALEMRVVEGFARVRAALFGLPFGDQALFVRRRVLDEIGGIPDVPVMEDVDLVQAMKHRGKLVLLEWPATTSARRYRESGWLRTVGLHWLAMQAWRLGVDRERIAGWLGR